MTSSLLTASVSFLSSASTFMTSRARSEVHGKKTVNSLCELSPIGLHDLQSKVGGAKLSSLLKSSKSFLSSASTFETSRARSEMHGGELTVNSLGELSPYGLCFHDIHSEVRGA